MRTFANTPRHWESTPAAVRDNRPVTFVNHATGPHAFDVMDDSRATRDVIRQVLGFLKSHLSNADGP